MTEEPGVSDQYRMASPWPVFVALGLALSEVGIFIGIFAVAVGGLLLFAGSVAGILKESGYVDGLWAPLLGFGVVLSVVGAGLVFSEIGLAFGAMSDAVTSPAGYGQIVPRALAIGFAGLILLAVGGTGRLLETNAADA